MSDVTWFGGAYLAFHAFGFLYALSLVGEQRKPLTMGSAFCGALIQGLIIWGLFTVGVTR